MSNETTAETLVAIEDSPEPQREVLQFDDGGNPVAEAPIGEVRIHWERPGGNSYGAEVRLVPDESGGFTVHVPELPGVVSEGETEQEALSNIREALAAAIESYRESGDKIPWQEPADTEGLSRWVIVDA